MKRYRIYLDTSVVGGVHDDEFAEQTSELKLRFESGSAVAVLSPPLFDEVADAPEFVQRTLTDLAAGAETLQFSVEAELLRDAYIAGGILTAKYASDALHVAYATIARVDVLASWNFKHMVNSDRIRRFNAINSGRGYEQVIILSPADIVQMMKEEEEQEDEDENQDV